MTRYTPSEKAKLLSKAHKVLDKGRTINEAARAVGICWNTLKRWLEEDDSQSKMAEDYGFEVSNVRITFGEARKPLSWKETQELCAEYFEHSKRIKGTKISIIWSIGDHQETTESWSHESDRIADEAYRKRMDEIKEQVGQDSLDQYQASQMLLDRISDLKAEVSNAAVSANESKRLFGLLSVVVGLTIILSLL